jgi:hypothetical protein
MSSYPNQNRHDKQNGKADFSKEGGGDIGAGTSLVVGLAWKGTGKYWHSAIMRVKSTSSKTTFLGAGHIRQRLMIP